MGTQWPESGPSLGRQILALEERKVSMQDAHWSMAFTGLVLLRLGKPIWFWLPIVLFVALVLLILLQAFALAFVVLLFLVPVGWYIEFSWIGWVEEHNAALDNQIEQLRRQR